MLAYPEHHSPSSIKQWRNAPVIWCLKYLYGWRDGGPKMWRGTAVEHGFAGYLQGAAFEAALNIALARYMNEASGEITPEIDECRTLIEPMLKQAITWHQKTMLSLARTQIKIETYLDGVERPFIGYVDFAFMDDSDLDTKTTEACPSKPRPDDVRQIAVYEKARKRRQSLLYITDKKHALFTPPQEELDAALQDIIVGAKSLERFLSVMPDRETALRCLPGNDHFSFNQAARAKLAEIGA